MTTITSIVETLSDQLDIKDPISDTPILQTVTSWTSSLTEVSIPSISLPNMEGIDLESLKKIPDIVENSSKLIPVELPNVENIKKKLQQLDELTELVDAISSEDYKDLFNEFADKFEDIKSDDQGNILKKVADILEAFTKEESSNKFTSVLKKVVKKAGLSQSPVEIAKKVLQVLSELSDAVNIMLYLEDMLSKGDEIIESMSMQIAMQEITQMEQTLETAFKNSVETIENLLQSKGLDKIDYDDVEIMDAISIFQESCSYLIKTHEKIAVALGSGEATLTYFNIEEFTTAVLKTNAKLKKLDTTSLKKIIKKVVEKFLSKLDLKLDTSEIPELDAIIEAIEEQLSDLQSKIDGFDLTAPLEKITATIESGTSKLARIDSFFSDTVSDVKTAFDGIESTIRKLPTEEIEATISKVTSPLSTFIDTINEAITSVNTQLKEAIALLLQKVSQGEESIDTLTEEINNIFSGIKATIDSLGLDTLISKISGEVTDFSQTLNKLDVKPFFDSATDLIDSASSTLDAVPIELLPSSLKDKIKKACTPIINTVNSDVEPELQGLFFVDDKFIVRIPIDDGLEELQKNFEVVQSLLNKVNPSHLTTTIDTFFKEVQSSITSLIDKIELKAIKDLFSDLKKTVTSINPQAELEPLYSKFDTLLSLIDDYSPDKIIAPYNAKITDARDLIIEKTKIKEWESFIDTHIDPLKEKINSFDLTQYKEPVSEIVDSIKTRFPGNINFFKIFGNLLSLTATKEFPINAEKLQLIYKWFINRNAEESLRAITENLFTTISTTKESISDFDIRTITKNSIQYVERYKALLPDEQVDEPLFITQIRTLDIRSPFEQLEANKNRFLTLLTNAEKAAKKLHQTGMSQITVSINLFKDALSPLQSFQELYSKLFAMLGIKDLSGGISSILQRVFETVSVERLFAIVTPLFNSIKSKAIAFIETLITPIKEAIQTVLQITENITLEPLIKEIDDVVQAFKTTLTQLHPKVILASIIKTLEDALKVIENFAPIQEIEILIAEVKTSIDTLFLKMSAEKIFEIPIVTFHELKEIVTTIDLPNILSPILDKIDLLAQQTTEGIGDTVDSLANLGGVIESKL